MKNTFVFPRDMIEVDSVFAEEILADTIYKEIRSRGGLFCVELHLTGFNKLPASSKVTRFYSDNQYFESFLNGIAIAYNDGFLLDMYRSISEVMRNIMLSLNISYIGRTMMSIVTPSGLIEMKVAYREDLSITLHTGGNATNTIVIVRSEDAHRWLRSHGYEC